MTREIDRMAAEARERHDGERRWRRLLASDAEHADKMGGPPWPEYVQTTLYSQETTA